MAGRDRGTANEPCLPQCRRDVLGIAEAILTAPAAKIPLATRRTLCCNIWAEEVEMKYFVAIALVLGVFVTSAQAAENFSRIRTAQSCSQNWIAQCNRANNECSARAGNDLFARRQCCHEYLNCLGRGACSTQGLTCNY